MGWASGMQAGTAMARNWIDTYRSADEAKRIKKVTDDKQQETYAFDKDTLARIAADQAAGKSLQATVGDDGAPVYHSFPAATPAQQQFTQGIVDPLPRTQSGQGLAPLSGAQPPRQLGVVGPGIDQQIDDYIEQGSAGLVREPLFPQGRSQRPLPRTSNGEGLATAAPPTDSESVAYRAKQQWTYGGRNYDAPLSEEALRLEQQRRIGIEVQKYRPEEGLRIQNDAARAMREEELHPLAVQAQKQGIESTGYTLRGQQRTEESTLRVNSFMDALSQPELQGRPLKELMDIGAKDYGLNLKELNSIIETKKGFSQGTLDAVVADLKLRTRDLDLPGLIKFHADEIDDGVHFVPRTVAGGKIVLDVVDDKDPSKVIRSTPAFDSGDHAAQYLRAQAVDPDVAVTVADAQKARDIAARKAQDDELNSASRRNLEGELAGYHSRMPQARSSSSASLYSGYKKGDRGTVLVPENGRMVYKDGVFDGESWGDGKRAFEGTAIPASMLDLKTIKQQAAKNAEKMADTPKQQLADGKVQKWTYDEAYRGEEQRLIQLEVERFANGYPLDGGEGGLPFGWEGGGPPPAGTSGPPAGNGGGLYRAAAPPRKQDVAARKKRQAQAAVAEKQAHKQQVTFHLSREEERLRRLTPEQRAALGIQAAQVGEPLRR